MATSVSDRLSPQQSGGLPSWLPFVNRVVMGLQRIGFVVGSMHVLVVPGRRSGVMRSTPVSLLTVEKRAAIVREFPRLVPRGVPFFTRLFGVGADAEAFAGLADRRPVFRVERR